MRKISNLEKLLKSDNVNGSIMTLDEFISELCKYGEEMDKLTAPQKIFYLNQTLEREVNSGGFDQYFSNSGSENAYETILSLQAIEANATVKILQRAIDFVLLLVEKNEDVPEEAWDKLDKEFYKYEDNLNVLNMEYVKRNKEFF